MSNQRGPDNPKHSFSSTSAYETCAFSYKQVNWLRIPEYQDTDNTQNRRGDAMHNHLEECILSDEPYTLEDELHPEEDYNWMLGNFRDLTGLKIPEMKLAIDMAWQPCEYKDPNAWYRGKIDLSCLNGTHLDMQDLKTGKRKFVQAEEFNRWIQSRHTAGAKPTKEQLRWIDDPTDYLLSYARQASEYSVLMFCHFLEVETITFKFIWSNVDNCQYDVFEFERDRDLPRLLETMLHWPTEIQESIETGNWPMKKSGLCNGWCTVVGCKNWRPKKEKY